MCGHKVLEREHGSKDMMHVMEYRESVRYMRMHFDELLKQRPQTWGHDLNPYYDVVRFQPIVFQAYSLLEQCLKLLVAIRKADYLDRRENRRRPKSEAQQDGHNLEEVFKKLASLDKDCKDYLVECYNQYASYIQCTEFSTLNDFLQKEGGNQVAWRYLNLPSERQERKARQGGGNQVDWRGLILERYLSMGFIRILVEFLGSESNMQKVEGIFNSEKDRSKDRIEEYPEKFRKIIAFLAKFLREEGRGKRTQGHNLGESERGESRNLLENFLQKKEEKGKTEEKPLSMAVLERMARKFEEDLPSIAYPHVLLGILLELTRCALDILEAKAFKKPYKPSGVYHRLEDLLESALQHNSSPPPSWSEQKFEDFLNGDDLEGWEQDNDGIINAFSKYIRVGDLQPYSDAMREWLDHSMKQFQRMAEEEHDIDLCQFLDMADKCCMTFHGKRFSFRNNRPKPLSTSLGDWRTGWSIKWQSGESVWEGPIDDPPSHRLDDWGLPLRPGQIFRARWHNRRGSAPARQELVNGKHGELKVLCQGRVLAHMWADVSSWGLRRESAKLSHATFRRIGDCRDADGAGSEPECHYPALVEGYACPECAGTGFCRNCLGEAAKADDCQVCVDAPGLCPTCRGYGLDSHHLIAETLGVG